MTIQSAPKSTAHALTIVSAIVELLLLLVLVLVIQRWGLERCKSLMVQPSFALDFRELRQFRWHMLWCPVISYVILSVVHSLL